MVKMIRENYVKEIQRIAKELEELRLEIYKNTNHELDKDYFEYTNELLFKTQHKLNNSIAEAISLLDYNDEM